VPSGRRARSCRGPRRRRSRRPRHLPGHRRPPARRRCRAGAAAPRARRTRRGRRAAARGSGRRPAGAPWSWAPPRGRTAPVPGRRGRRRRRGAGPCGPVAPRYGRSRDPGSPGRSSRSAPRAPPGSCRAAFGATAPRPRTSAGASPICPFGTVQDNNDGSVPEGRLIPAVAMSRDARVRVSRSVAAADGEREEARGVVLVVRPAASRTPRAGRSGGVRRACRPAAATGPGGPPAPRGRPGGRRRGRRPAASPARARRGRPPGRRGGRRDRRRRARPGSRRPAAAAPRRPAPGRRRSPRRARARPRASPA
jgi:hypothetical protein